jgi:hypothetical protein
MMQNDPVLEALDEVMDALRANAARIESVVARAEQMHREREAGRSYRDIETDEGATVIVRMTSDNMSALAEAGSRLRRAEARALHAEGMTMEQIAELFGVTRQRVSALLKDR